MEVCIGLRPNRKGRGGREILGLGFTQPLDCSPLPSTEQVSDSNSISPAQDFETALWNARNEWSIARCTLPECADDWLRGGGFAGRGKLSAQDAERLLRSAFAAIDGKRSPQETDTLVAYRRGGGA